MNNKVYKRIGNQNPFKLTPKSAKDLLIAVIDTESKIITVNRDTTLLPMDYMITTIEISQNNIEKFESLSKCILEDVDIIRGCG